MDPDQLQALIQAVAPGPGHGKRLSVLSDPSADAWMAWRLTFQNVCTLKGWTDAQAKAQMVAAMEGSCARLVSHVHLPPLATAREALDLYGEQFIPAAYGKMSRMMFKTAAQEDNESIVAWHTRLRELYLRAHPNFAQFVETTSEIIETFIMGLQHPEIRQKTLDDNPTTFAQALTNACERAANVAFVNQHEGRGRHAPSLYALQGIQAVSVDGAVSSAVGAVSESCFVCQAKDHFVRSCPHKGNMTSSELRRVNEELRRVRGAGQRGGRNPRGRGRPQPRVADISQQLLTGGARGGKPRRGRAPAGNQGSMMGALTDALLAISEEHREPQPRGAASGN